MIRDATLDDIPAMMDIRLSVTENRLSDPSRVPRALYVAYLHERGKGWVAVEDGRIVGFSFADRRGEIWALFVRAAYEGRGIGRALLDRAVRWLHEGGHPRILLSTEPGTRAERLYLRRGWTPGPLRANGDREYTLEP